MGKTQFQIANFELRITTETRDKKMMTNLTSYFEQYALISLEKQEKLSRLLGEHSVELDLDAGMIRFSGGMEFPFQVLGTESDNTLTWLWGWAEEQTEVPERLLSSAFQMREWGAAREVSECLTPSVDLNKADGHMFSLIASEVCNAECYYQDAYEGGALFLLLFGDVIGRQPPFDVAGLSRQFSFLMSVYDFNHRNAFRSYLHHRSLPLTEHATFIVTQLDSGEDLRANFDPSGRLLSINGKDMPVG